MYLSPSLQVFTEGNINIQVGKPEDIPSCRLNCIGAKKDYSVGTVYTHCI